MMSRGKAGSSMTQPRIIALPDLLALVHTRDLHACVLDLETNGFGSRDSVLSCSAIRYRVTATTHALELLGAMDRYYYPIEPLNAEATRVNGLSLGEIAARRQIASYPQLFRSDAEMISFIDACDLVVAHNAGFDLRFLPAPSAGLAFCTMKASTGIVCLRRAGGGLKFPTLHEAARHYRVDTACARAHESLCDACIAAMVFREMIAKPPGGRRAAPPPRKPCEIVGARAPSRERDTLAP
jgi:DNA polymerase III epsilon subunit-like protein